MRLRKTFSLLSWCLALVVALAIVPSMPASAQGLSGITAPLVAGLPLLGRILDYNVPGLANPASPLVFPPYVRGEVKARPVFVFSTEHTFKAPRQAISLDLEKDLGFDDTWVLIEFMVQGQVGSLSARAHYNTYLSTLKSDLGHLDWPPVRVGLDMDLINSRTLRFGVNTDFYWENPVFSVVLPVLGAQSIKWDRPITAGLQASLNPPGWGGLAFSFDSRVRWPITEKSRVTEFDIAGGFRTPETVLGATAVRAGYRYTAIQLRHSGDFQVNLQWSGVFGELVYLY